MREHILKLEKENKAIHEERSDFKEKIKKLEELTDKIPNLLEAYESVKKILTDKFNDISDKEIIETLGLKEISNKSTKKLDIKLSK